MSDLLFVQSRLLLTCAVPKFVLLLILTLALGFLVHSGGHVAASLLDELTFAVAVLRGGRVCASWWGCGR